ncbi:rab3 GTPase-activating protein non-catalytic subunit [Prorops nasuta]|uniref:rab3 GTPase-activating protein non-catalytic subunit n=1 Tax=Prorops nasuta TaxID=863751 RepID=UPI0034CF71F7
MSCQIKPIGNLRNVEHIRRILFGEEIGRFDSIPRNELPLQECLVSLSSYGDILALAWNTKLIILAAKWDLQQQDEIKNKFHIVWNGSIAHDQKEWITSILCLPLMAAGKASTIGSDWTCVAVGFNTGYVRFYTETGSLLVEEQLHNEPVLNIKCQSFSPPKHSGDPGLVEEVHIVYSSTVCILQGFPLFSTLKACRNHLARVQANCNDTPPATTLAFKKWGFKNQDITNDAEIIGSTTVNVFDHLMTASLCGGYNAAYRSSAPQHNLIIAIGKRPFIGFHYAFEGGTTPVLSDVAIAMASKVANAIGTAIPWFRGSSKNPAASEKGKATNNEPAETMTCRFGLSDVMREGDCILCNSRKTLSVITDAMGRVILVDNRRGMAIRMWKGYRDAQCGWIEVDEEGKHSSRKSHSRGAPVRTAQFLIIYAPKKGIIDIWGIQQGNKITTFTASKNGRLLNINYGLFGTNDTATFSKNKPPYSCVFLDPIGGLKEIIVPFHFALSSKNGKRARDIHLMRKLKTFMREEEYDEEKLIIEVTNVCLDIKTNEIKVQTLEMLINNKHTVPDALMAAVNCFTKKTIDYDDAEEDPTSKTLYHLAAQVQHVVEFYKYIRMRFDTPPEYDTVTPNTDISEKNLATILLTSEREVHRILKLNKLLTNLEEPLKYENKVRFMDDGRSFLDFLSCFEFGTSGLIKLQRGINREKRLQISQLICHGWMYSTDPIYIWKSAAARSSIDPRALMQFALLYWTVKKKGASLEIELKRFTQLLHAICMLSNIDEICADYNETSSWWRNVRHVLAESTNPFNALTATLACRAVAVTLESYKDKLRNTKENDDNGNEDEDKENGNIGEHSEKCEEKRILVPEEESLNSSNDWENVSKDTCQFSLLAGNLEDITVLQAVVCQSPPQDNTVRGFKLPYEKLDISLSVVLSKGKGSVSELVAKWLSSTGIDPAQLVNTKDIEFDQFLMPMEALNVEGGCIEETHTITNVTKQNAPELVPVTVELACEAKSGTTAQASILEKISLLKNHFPYSLTSSVLLANLCWEFAMFWNKETRQLEALEAVLTVLRQIPLKHIKHGICCLLWTLHIKKRLESAAKLINKSGKLPKERLCTQEIGLTDTELTKFLEHCVSFLNVFLDSEMLEQEKLVIKSEELWEGQSIVGPQAFIGLVASQTPAWYDLVMLHLQLANVLHMIANFSLRVSKPLNNLFEPVAHPYLFQDITYKAGLTWYRDDKRDSLRTEFLCRIITASMDFIHQDTTDERTFSSSEAILWMSKCQTLATMWRINNDELRIHQVCQLYINGFDRLAEEVQLAVNDVEKLAEQLLPIAGKRMMAYISKKGNLLEELSTLSPALTKYLEDLNVPEVIITNCSNEHNIELVRRIVRHMPENHRLYYLAMLMLDATFVYTDRT